MDLRICNNYCLINMWLKKLIIKYGYYAGSEFYLKTVVK